MNSVMKRSIAIAESDSGEKRSLIHGSNSVERGVLVNMKKTAQINTAIKRKTSVDR